MRNWFFISTCGRGRSSTDGRSPVLVALLMGGNRCYRSHISNEFLYQLSSHNATSFIAKNSTRAWMDVALLTILSLEISQRFFSFGVKIVFGIQRERIKDGVNSNSRVACRSLHKVLLTLMTVVAKRSNHLPILSTELLFRVTSRSLYCFH
jgi:hypothetical protein